MRILIAGGAGFIGSHLTKKHLDKKDDVYVIDNLLTSSRENFGEYLNHKKLHFFHKDLLSFRLSVLPRFDIIYHLASPASPIQYKKNPVITLRVNSEGMYKLLEFMKKTKSGSFVFTSTSEVYGDPLEHPQKEEYWGNVNPNGVRSCYDEAKRYGEAMAMTYQRSFGLDIRIARFFNTYGPYMEKNDGRVVSNFVMQALTGKPITIYGTGQQTRSFCYVDDTVEGLYRLGIVPNISGEVINIGNPSERTILELAEIIKKMTGTKSEIIKRPIDQDDPKKRKPSITKAKKLLGWSPTIPLAEGLEKTIQYFKERFV